MKIFMVAGEASGDVLGAALMRDLHELDFEGSFVGIGGAEMQSAGLQSFFPMSDLSVMGLSEVIKHLPLLLKRMKETMAAIENEKPDILVTIDSPDFCFRIAKKVKKKFPSIKIIHMVAPTVWAWRPGRAKKIAKFLDGLMCLFPFEPRYFTSHGLKAEFIGHPLVGQIKPTDKNAFCAKYDLDPARPILCLLPGSRTREIETLWPIFAETFKRIYATHPETQAVVPTLPHLMEKFGAGHDNMVFITDRADKLAAMQAADAAIHASGTVALELALCGTPMVTAYKLSPLSAWIGKRMVKTKFFNLVNILFNQPVVPEMMQEHCTAAELSGLAQALLTHQNLNELQKSRLTEIAPMLKEPTKHTAARFVASFF
jgi:lipid-A-disaccharide synthase